MTRRNVNLCNNFAVFNSTDDLDTIKDKLYTLLSYHNVDIVDTAYFADESKTVFEYILDKNISILEKGAYEYVKAVKTDIDEFVKYDEYIDGYKCNLDKLEPTDMFIMVLSSLSC